MKEQDLREKLFGAFMYRITGNGVEKAIQITLDYAREEAIGFVQWLEKNCSLVDTFYIFNISSVYFNENYVYHYDLNQLYKIYLTTKTK